MAKVNLSSPWEIFYRELSALFSEDPEIEVIYDEDKNVITLHVDNSVKADALSKLLPPEKTFGNVTLKINVVPANGEDSPISLFERAFAGNPAFAYSASKEGLFNVDYIVFRKVVVQYFADNIGDVNGNVSTLYQDIANRIFEDRKGVLFCTDEDY